MERLYRWNEVVNPEMGLNLAMNKYRNTKTGEEVIMHNDKGIVQNAKGEWKRVDRILTIGSIDIPKPAATPVAPSSVTKK